MSSLKKELNKIRTPLDSLYQVDAFRRTSLVYDDPRRVETVQCYKDAIKNFQQLCERHAFMSRFHSTLFSAASVQMQITSLTAAQKKFIEKEVTEFLCLASPLLRETQTLYSIEWLLHKYRIEQFHITDLIRCVLPYYETALFPKFLQLFNFSSIPAEWAWLAAYQNEIMPRGKFLKKCGKSNNLLPFLCSSLMKMCQVCEANQQLTRDYCNLFSMTVHELLQSMNQNVRKMANIVDMIQGTLLSGLKNVSCPPLQSAMCLLIVNINEKMELNQELVQSWIKCLLKFCAPDSKFVHLKIVLDLQHRQNIACLTDKWEARRQALQDTLPEREAHRYRKLMQKASAIAGEETPQNAIDQSEIVQAATTLVEDKTAPMEVEDLPTIAEKDALSERKLRKMIKRMSPEELYGQVIWQKFHRAVLAFAPQCLRELMHEVETEALEMTPDWPLRDRLQLRQKRLFLLKYLDDQPQLEKFLPMLDQALSNLLIYLVADCGQTRQLACTLLGKVCTSDLKNLRLLRPVEEDIRAQETLEMLRAESLVELQRQLQRLASLTLSLLAHEDVEDQPECWLAALKLFSPSTMDALQGVIWNKYLGLLRKHPLTLPQSLCLACKNVLTEEFFHGLNSTEAQRQLLTVLLDAASSSQPDQTSSSLLPKNAMMVQPEEILRGLGLDHDHFIACLELLETKRIFGANSQRSLRSRVKESVVASGDQDAHLPVTLNYLRGLTTVSAVLAASIPQLFRHEVKTVAAAENSLPSHAGLARLVAKFAGKQTEANISVEDQLKQQIDQASRTLGQLITPIVRHILILNDEEKDSAYCTSNNKQASSSHDSDDGMGSSDEDEEDGDLMLPQSFLEQQTPLRGGGVTLMPTPMKTPGPAVVGSDYSQQLRMRTSLMKTSLHQLVTALGLIFGQANERRNEALAQATRNQKHRAAYKLVQVANQSISEGAIATAKVCIQPLFQCMEIFPAWPSLHQQMLTCLIELAAMFPLALCEHLMQFISWVTGSSHGRMMRLEDAHNLQLIGRLVSVAIPSLVEASKQPPLVALDVMLTFVDNFAAFATSASRLVRKRRMALYCGVIHGLARACLPLSIARNLDEGSIRPELEGEQTLQLLHAAALRTDKSCMLNNKRSNALATWLWISACFFLNRDWSSNDIADQVPSFLVSMFNEFQLQIQVQAWCQCLAYLLYLNKRGPVASLEEMTPSVKKTKPAIVSMAVTPIVRRSQRKRLVSTSMAADQQEVLEVQHVPINKRRRTNSVNEPNELTVQSARSGLSTPPALVEVQNFCESECARLAKLLAQQNTSQQEEDQPSMWPLAGRLCQLLHALLSSASHTRSLQTQIAENNSDLVSDMYGRLVHHALRLMTHASSSQESSCAKPGLNEVLSSLQNGLMKIQECVRTSLYVRMLTELLDVSSPQSGNHGLNRRLLDLLAARLNHLVTSKTSLKNVPQLEEILRELLARCHAILVACVTTEASSALMRSLLACLLHLVKLMADTNPQECIKLLEVALDNLAVWWPQQPTNSCDTPPAGSHHAESRSILCTLLTESITRLGFWLHPRWSQLGPRILQLASDHCACAARIHSKPVMLQTMARLETNPVSMTAGAITSRDQHLRSGVILLNCLMRFCLERQFFTITRSMDQQNPLDEMDLASQLDDVEPCNLLLQFRPDALPMIDRPGVPLERDRLCPLLSGQMLMLIARLANVNLIEATGCRPERSAVQLTQLSQLILNLKHGLVHSPGVTQLTFCLYTLLKYAVHVADWPLFIGLTDLMITFRESVPASLEMDETLAHCWSLSTQARFHSVLTHKPELLYHLGQLCLTQLPMEHELKEKVTDLGVRAMSTIVGAFRSSADQASQLLRKFCSWVASARHVGRRSVDLDSNQDDVLSHVSLVLGRVTSMLQVLISLAPEGEGSSPEAAQFVEMCRGADISVFLQDMLLLLTTTSRKSLLKKLSSASCLREFSQLLHEQCPLGHPAKFYPEETRQCVRVLVQALTCWLKAEQTESDSILTTLLTVAGGGSTHQDITTMPQAVVTLLDLCPDPEEDNTPLCLQGDQMLTPLVKRYLKMAMADEALVRPLGVALCQRLLSNGGGIYGVAHWQTRLACVNLLRLVYEQLLETDRLGQEAMDHSDREEFSARLSQVSCLVNDTLAALQEALQDDRPEVEEAANKLFSDLETAGVLSR